MRIWLIRTVPKPMRTWFTLTFVLFIFTALNGHWVRAAFWYVLSGILWVEYERHKPAFHRREMYRYLRGIVVGWLVWPFTVLLAIRESWWTLRENEEQFFRFTVTWGDPIQKNGGMVNFRKWSDAVGFARGKARELGQDVWIFDKWRYEKYDKLLQDCPWVSYHVSQSGKVEWNKPIDLGIP